MRFGVPVILLALAVSPVLRAGSVTVNDPADTLHPGPDGCAATGAAPCSLRDAITFANASPGADEILIQVSPVSVGPDPLPQILGETTILSGLSSGMANAVIDGSGAGSADGLVVVGSGVRLRALTVRSFGGTGVLVTGGSAPLLEALVVEENGSDGIVLANGATDGAFTGIVATVSTRNGGSGLRIGASAADAATQRNGSGPFRSFGNLGRAVDLGGDGPTANDALDADTGPNGLQNAPVVTSAIATGDIVRVAGTLHAAPGGTFTVRVFTSQAPHPTGAGEAETILCTTSVTTDGSGAAAFACAADAFSSQVVPGDWAAAAALDAQGNLSELSAAVLVLPPPRVSYYALPPCRAVDTREGSGTPLAAASARSFAVAATCGVPFEALAVAANVTVVNAPASGTLRIFASGTPIPLASVVSFPAATRANNAIVSLLSIPAGSVTAWSDQSHHLLVDVAGYFR